MQHDRSSQAAGARPSGEDRSRGQFISLSLALLGLACADLEPPVGGASAKVSSAASALLAPAPTQPVGYYDHFGELLPPREAARRVAAAGMSTWNPASYRRLGMVYISNLLLAQGEFIFRNRDIGDDLGLHQVMGFASGLRALLPEIIAAIGGLGGAPTTNLQVRLSRELVLGSTRLPAGSILPTGLDVEAGALLPVGLRIDGNVTCAICHVTLDGAGRQLVGVPNADLNAAALIALSPNSAAAFARLVRNPLPLVEPGAPPGRTILDSAGNPFTLPAPAAVEKVVDDLLLAVPPGRFESSPDGISNTTEIPAVFTMGSKLFTAGGEFGVGPFSGLGAQASSVHSSEVNLLEAAQRSAETLGLDPEVYLGIALQNAANPGLRLPAGAPVRPSEFLRQVAGPPAGAELEDQVIVAGQGEYPGLSPSLFTYNGLAFSPASGNWLDPASGRFLFAGNAMAAWQNSLVPPPNRSAENAEALASGAVQRGAELFIAEGCASCHPGPYFTDNRIWPSRVLAANPARAISRHGMEDLLVPPRMYSLDTAIPPRPDAEVLTLPTAGFSPTPTSLPFGHEDPEGGYKTFSLRGIYLSPPYLHDGGAAAAAGALSFDHTGALVGVDPTRLGIPGTAMQQRPADAASSLRVLLDEELRGLAVAVNRSRPTLVQTNLDGTGHHFFVARERQDDLIRFLLALDDDPGRF